jgi:hypothetical protein
VAKKSASKPISNALSFALFGDCFALNYKLFAIDRYRSLGTFSSSLSGSVSQLGDFIESACKIFKIITNAHGRNYNKNSQKANKNLIFLKKFFST